MTKFKLAGDAYPLPSAAAITSTLVAIVLFALCGRGSGGEIVFRNEVPKKMVSVTCEPAVHHGPRNLRVAYLSNITFTVTPDLRHEDRPVCDGWIYDPFWGRGRGFTLYSPKRDYRRCVKQCTIVATTEAVYVTEIVQSFVHREY